MGVSSEIRQAHSGKVSLGAGGPEVLVPGVGLGQDILCRGPRRWSGSIYGPGSLASTPYLLCDLGQVISFLQTSISMALN